jgi:hypothetical protein
MFTVNSSIENKKPKSLENPLDYLIGHILSPEEPVFKIKTLSNDEDSCHDSSKT